MTAFAAVCLAQPAYPIDPNRMLSQYIRDHWGLEQGFTGGSVTSFAQTPDGYLWIGTEKGLIRFDGLNFQIVQQANSELFPIDAVQGLVTDASGNLWVLLKSTRVLRLHDRKFELGREEAEFGITSIGRRGDGTVLFSSLPLGVLTRREERFEILTSPADRAPSEGTATTESDNRSTRLSWATQLAPHRFAEPNSVVTSMTETSDGKVWLGTRDKGLFYMSEGRVFSAERGQSHNKINCLLALENGELWVGTDRGIVRWNSSEVSAVGVPASLGHIQVLSMIRDHDSNIWVGTAGGLIRVNGDGVSVDGDDPRGSAAVTALFEDREGNLWIGTARGLDRLRDSAFVTYTAADLKSQSIGALYVDPGDKTWFAPSEGGLRWRKGGKGGVVTVAGLSQDIVYSISSSGQNELWVGRQRGGLTHLSEVNGSITTRTYTQADGLPQNGVYAVHQNRSGSVWSATLSVGVSEFKGGHFTRYTTANGLASNKVSSIAEGADGTMWFGTPNGLSKMAAGGWKTYTIPEGLPSSDVNSLFFDSAGVLWIGTAAGLAYLTGDHIQVPRAVPESLHEPVFGMAEDISGWLWITTAGHVLRVKRSNLTGDALSEADVREYGLEDGLLGTEGVKRYRSVVKDSQGNIWFSTNRGISMVNPARANVNSAPALVHIEAVLADGNPLEIGGLIRLPAKTQRATFRYVGLSLANSERVRYRYRLEGFDREWSQPTTNQEATYGNLNAGSYRFDVTASNSDGIWNNEGTSIDFSVIPAFYQTNWFRALCLFGILTLLWAFYQLRIRHLQRQFNIGLEARVNERTRIARELHDTLLQSFQALLLHLQSVSNVLPARPDEAKRRVEGVIEQASQAITEGRDTVHEMRSAGLSTTDLGQAISNFARELVSGSASEPVPEVHVQVEGTPRPLNPIVRDEVYRIATEAVRNAVRHAHAKQIEAEIRYDQHHLRLRIRDNGTGIDPAILNRDHKAGHWGLRGMRERAKLVGGMIEVWSQLDTGTEIELNIPAASAYAKSQASQWSVFSRLWRS